MKKRCIDRNTPPGSAQPYSPAFCAQRLKVLADPNRFAILTLLLQGPQYVWQLNQALPLEQSLLSHHLKILRQEGLVESQRSGKAVLYSLAPGVRVNSGNGINLSCCILSFTPNCQMGSRQTGD